MTDVLAIQARLNALGYKPGNLDGDYGPKTAKAIQKFEADNGLAPDGIIDPALVKKLYAGVASAEPPWMVEARTMLGIREAPGSGESPDVLKMFADAGHPEVKHDAVPWCAAFVGAALHRAGIKGTGSLWALDYRNWGVSLPGPIMGAIGVKVRSGGGHVTLAAGLSADKSRVFCLGGNQSDMVNVTSFPTAVFVWRWPAGFAIPDPPLPMPSTITGARVGGSEA